MPAPLRGSYLGCPLPPGTPVPHHDDLLRERAAVVVVDPDAHLVAPLQVVGAVELSLEVDRCMVVITHRDRAAPVRIRDLQGPGVGVDRADDPPQAVGTVLATVAVASPVAVLSR